MIHAHHFHFVDQPALQAEYESFGFSSGGKDAPTIVVREIEHYAGFDRRLHITSMSGRHCTYLADNPIGELGCDQDWGLEVQGVLSLVWDAKNRTILYGRGREFTAERLSFWIFHTFFPIVLELERRYKMLHVGAVEIAGQPILFSAGSFGGKSTMTDFFLRQGHALYADDTLAVRMEGDRCFAYPSFPYHRPYRQPETLGKRAKKIARHVAPILAQYELSQGEPDAPITIQEVHGIEKFRILAYSRFIRFPFLRKEAYEFFSRMARSTPVYIVSVPWDRKRLPEVYEAIVRHTRTFDG